MASLNHTEAISGAISGAISEVTSAAMPTDLLMVLLLLGAAIVMFAINRPRVDAVALIMLVLLPFTGVLTMSEALAGFSNPNIVLIGAMFVIGEAWLWVRPPPS